MILKIARMGHPVLARRAEVVGDARAPEIRRLIADMIETMEDSGGTGLAAPQVHVPLRVVVFKVEARRLAAETPPGAEPPQGVPLTAMINPAIEPLGEAVAEGWEACLSLPQLAGRVPRFAAIRYRFTTAEGETVTREAHGFHARVVQHECDHLDGILYPQRMRDLSSFGFAEDLAKGRPEMEDIADE